MTRLLPLVGSLILCAAVAGAAPFTFTATLSGPDESPPNASPGTGTASVVIDDVAHTMLVAVTFSGLVGTTTASHIHCCTLAPLTGNVGVATVTPTFVGFPLGVTSGTYTHFYDLTMATSFNVPFLTANGGPPGAEAALLAGMLGGNAYLNVHTSAFPGGEIRGFLKPVSEPATVPEPATIGLLGFGLGALVTARRRRRS